MEDNEQDILNDVLIITKKFRSPNEFSLYIEEKVVNNKIGYMDAVIHYCAELDIEIESISKLINQSLKDKIRLEAQEFNYLKKQAKLPI
jgi:hypothetical protein